MIEVINIEKKFKIKFINKNLLKNSLTHKSHDPKKNYEKLEFIGDRVLGLVIANKLLELYPDEKEGIMDKKLANLVNKNKCYEIGKKLELHKYILVGNIKNKDKKEKTIQSKIIADCCEAVIGAIYIDQGLKVARSFILNSWKNELKFSDKLIIDSKTRLQEYSLKKFKKLPKYKLLENSGPRHKPIFKVAVKISNTDFISSSGESKKIAEQNAAKLLLNKLKI
jgi:ribonuclease-3|tara:strand:+ start:188 stop:859 length:672 start_codon:yes stop_codon:yes gene_type:complete